MEFDDRIIDRVADAIVEALVDGAEEIAEESTEQVPKKSGALHDSCKVVRQSDPFIKNNNGNKPTKRFDYWGNSYSFLYFFRRI